MDITSIPRILLLCTGGPSPALNAVDIQNMAIEGALGLETAGTVYTGAVNPSLSRLALGTKLGYLLTGRLGKKCIGDWENIAMRSPILCTTFVDDSRIVIATADGRVATRDLHTPEEETRLLLKDASVFTLTRAGAIGLAALDTAGTLRLWKAPATDTLPRRIAGPSPAPAIRGARIKLVYWPETQQLVYPAAGGGLALIDTTTETVMAVPAHEGDWYVLLLRGGDLVSVGHTDGVMHQWRPGETTPTPIGSGPARLVDGAPLIGHGEPWLAIDIDGRALVLDGQGSFLKTLEGVERIRAIVAPGSDAWGTLDRTWREREVTRLREEALAASGRNELEVFGELLGEIEAMGYGYAADELRAWDAERRGDYLRAVRHRVYLVEKLPAVAQCAPQLCAAAALFERIGQPDVALYAYQKAAELGATPEGAARIKVLAGDLSGASPDDHVVERAPNVSAEANAACAALLERPHAFYFVYKRLASWPCPGLAITPEELAAKYEDIRREPQFQGLNGASAGLRSWWCQTGITTRSGIDLALTTCPDTFDYRYWLGVEHRGADTVVSPYILARPCLDTAPIEAVREGARPALDLYLARLNKALREALWRITNSKTAQSNRRLQAAAATE